MKQILNKSASIEPKPYSLHSFFIEPEFKSPTLGDGWDGYIMPIRTS